jgi:hypothetical protein
MESIDTIFSDLPKSEFTLWKKVPTGNAKTENITNQNIPVSGFLQPKLGLKEGIVSHTLFDFYSNATQTTIDYEDRLSDDIYEYTIIEYALFNFDNEIEPYYQLLLERVKK